MEYSRNLRIPTIYVRVRSISLETADTSSYLLLDNVMSAPPKQIIEYWVDVLFPLYKQMINLLHQHVSELPKNVSIFQNVKGLIFGDDRDDDVSIKEYPKSLQGIEEMKHDIERLKLKFPIDYVPLKQRNPNAPPPRKIPHDVIPISIQISDFESRNTLI